MHSCIEISSFWNELNHPFSLTGFYFKSEIIEGSHEIKITCFLTFGHFS